MSKITNDGTGCFIAVPVWQTVGVKVLIAYSMRCCCESFDCLAGSICASCVSRETVAGWQTRQAEVGGAVYRGLAWFTWYWWVADRCRCRMAPATSTSSSSSPVNDTKLEYFYHHYLQSSLVCM